MHEEDNTSASSPSELVRINVDTEAQIATLYDVSPKIAADVVKSRTEQGPFRQPEDLMRVSGISRNLALTLAPHIDWSSPEERPPVEKRSFGLAGIASIGVIGTLLLARRTADHLLDIINQYPVRRVWLVIWINISILWAILLAAAAIGATLLNSIQIGITEKRLRQVYKFTIWAIAAGCASTGLGNAINYQVVLGWNALLRNETAFFGGLLTITLGLIASPILFGLWRRSKQANKTLNYVSMGASFLVLPMFSWYTWITRYDVPLVMIVVAGIVGILLALLSIESLRYGKSYGYLVLELLLELPSNEATDMASWRRWINIRLPNPSDQQALKRALDEAYPRSRIRTFSDIVLLGAGGWLVLTAVSAIIQTIIQVWLEPHLK